MDIGGGNDNTGDGNDNTGTGGAGNDPAEEEDDDISVPIGKPGQTGGDSNSGSSSGQIDGNEVDFDRLWGNN